MPGGDKTGPAGEGPAAGRKMGFCSGNDQPGYMSGQGQGMSRGRRFSLRGRKSGCGMGHGSKSELFNENVLLSEIAVLKEKISSLEEQLAVKLTEI